MSNDVQDFIDALQTELTACFGPRKYTIEAREPTDEELLADKDHKQIFITTEGIDPGEADIADEGQTTSIVIPVLVSCIMQRPAPKLASGLLNVPLTIQLYAEMLTRRLTIVQAVQRVRRAFNITHNHVTTRFLKEQPVLINGYVVSITGAELELHLDSEEDI